MDGNEENSEPEEERQDDDVQVVDVVEKTVEEVLDDRLPGGDGEAGTDPEVVPAGQRGAEDRDGPEGRGDMVTDDRGHSVRVNERRDVDGDGIYAATYRLLRAQTQRDWDTVKKEQALLARAGHYGKETQDKVMKADRAVMVTSTEGQPFLPTTILENIEDIMKDYGAAREICTVITGLTGTTKIPNVSGRFEAFAVNESVIIKARKASFGSADLDPDKWGVIVPWTNEMDEEVGAQLVQKIVDLAGEAFARKEDATVFTADGTATFHSLTGVINDTNVSAHTLATGSTSFENVGYDDLIDMRRLSAPAVRGLGTYVFHHDFEDIFDKLKDNDGNYIFGAGQAENRIERIRGRDIAYTEVMPSITDDAADTPFGAFGDFSFVTMGFQRDLTATLLSEATIQDVDDASLIHLAAQDSQALRFTALWDVARGLNDAFSRVKTAAS